MSNNAIDLGFVVIGILVLVGFIYWFLRCIADSCDTTNSSHNEPPIDDADPRVLEAPR